MNESKLEKCKVTDINWRVRFKNKTFLLTFICAILAFVYQMLGMFGIVAPISEEQIIQVVGIVLNVLVTMGVIIDPTTAGTSDSIRAMSYNSPAK